MWGEWLKVVSFSSVHRAGQGAGLKCDEFHQGVTVLSHSVPCETISVSYSLLTTVMAESS